MTAYIEQPDGTAEKRPVSREEMARHAIAMQLHSIRAACEAALASLALLDSGQSFERPPTRRPPNTEAEARFFGKMKDKQTEEAGHAS